MRVVCCFLETEGKFFVLARPNPRTEKYEWDLPAGKVRASESNQAAVTRIVLEETGYVSRPSNFYLLGTFQFISGSNEPYAMYAFRLKLEEPFQASKKFKTEWVSPEECLAKSDLIKNLRQLLVLTGYAK